MNRKNLNQVLALSAVALGVCAVFWLSSPLYHPVRQWTHAMAIIALIEGIGALGGMLWASKRSAHAFFTMYGATVLLRVAILGVAAFLLSRWEIAMTWPLLTLVALLTLTTIAQIPFLSPTKPT